MEIALVLQNIRSSHNAGSIFRTADATGVSKILLVGYTPGPLDQFGMLRPDFGKVSLGAEKTVPHEHKDTLSDAIQSLKLDGYTVVGIELDENAIPLFQYKPGPDAKIALVLGNEVSGISKEDLALCDAIVEIPMHGSKESLNVSVAAGVAVYGLLRNCAGEAVSL
ncbi:MAG TPA: TrmH family RNA methyltransferase [Candidatus Paceibacterota bacterium]|nr:TrmH family RNA methyltransferase [Candidatus Paceibacterota bacterium]